MPPTLKIKNIGYLSAIIEFNWCETVVDTLLKGFRHILLTIAKSDKCVKLEKKLAFKLADTILNKICTCFCTDFPYIKTNH